MAPGKQSSKSASRARPAGSASGGTRPAPAQPPVVSGRWLLTALAIAIPAALFCTWAVFCLLFWQGGWQLLYQPSATVVRTPSNVGLSYSPVGFATTDAGLPQLAGWWISANPPARYTVLYLHGQAGNLGDTLGDLGLLHAAGVNVLAFDYRGYGASEFVRPSETRWREDAASALDYLAATRHIDPHSIVLVGDGLGANLALEVAASHPELAGVVLKQPLNAATAVVFNDPRARMVPAHLLFGDRYDMTAPAAALRVPSLWLMQGTTPGQKAPGESGAGQNEPAGVEAAFQKVTARKTPVWLPAGAAPQQAFADAFARWLGGLHT